MLLLARLASGKTQQEVCRDLDMSQAKYSKLEVGVVREDDAELVQKVSVLLQRPPSFFYQKAEIFGKAAPFNFRKRASYPAKMREKAEALANICRLHIRRILEHSSLKTNLPSAEVMSGATPEGAAKLIREYWKVPRGPITNVTKLMEDAGIVVILSEFDTHLLDGFTIADDSPTPLVFQNMMSPGDRLRFTLAHELGHILLHRTIQGEDVVEKEADRFAAEFLMPEEEIAGSLKQVDLRLLADLKPKWKSSMAALLMRSHTLQLISDNQYRFLWSQMARYGYKTREPASLDIPREEPSLLKRLVHTYVRGAETELDFFTQLKNDFPTIRGEDLIRVSKSR